MALLSAGALHLSVQETNFRKGPGRWGEGLRKIVGHDRSAVSCGGHVTYVNAASSNLHSDRVFAVDDCDMLWPRESSRGTGPPAGIMIACRVDHLDASLG